MDAKKLKKINITKDRKYNIVKSNDFIQQTRYDLSLHEQKIILRLIQMINPGDTEFQEYTFYIKSFCELCGIDTRSGKNYFDIKKAVKDLSDKSYWVMISDKKETLMRWIEEPTFDYEHATITLKISRMMKPYLLELKEKFTQYSYYYTLAMKSKYSIRLYELLKSYENLKEKSFDLNALKIMLMAERYVQWNDFKRKVLSVAIEEINLLTDLQVEYAIEKEGKKIARLYFSIKSKRDVSEKTQAWIEIENRLNKKQFVEPWRQAVAEVMPNE